MGFFCNLERYTINTYSRKNIVIVCGLLWDSARRISYVALKFGKITEY
jgi:hypothetical protein